MAAWKKKEAMRKVILTALCRFIYTSLKHMKTMLLVLVLAAVCCGAQEANQPITFRYIRDSDLKETPPLPIGMIFWVTNNTALPQSIVVLGLQVKKGSNWVDLPPMETPDLIKFSQPGPLTGVPRYFPTQL